MRRLGSELFALFVGRSGALGCAIKCDRDFVLCPVVAVMALAAADEVYLVDLQACIAHRQLNRKRIAGSLHLSGWGSVMGQTDRDRICGRGRPESQDEKQDSFHASLLLKRNDHNLLSINGLGMRKIVRGPGQTALFCRNVQELRESIFSVLTCPCFGQVRLNGCFGCCEYVRRGHGFNRYGQGPGGLCCYTSGPAGYALCAKKEASR